MRTIKIARVPIPTPTLWPYQTTNCYLIGNEKESILVDAGYDQPETKSELHKALLLSGMAQPSSIYLTHYHPDHAPGVNQLLDWEATIYCHQDEWKEIQSVISPKHSLKVIDGKEPLQIDGHEVQVLHTPGHTRGHISLYIPSRKTLIAGDNIVAEGTSWIGPPDGDMTDFLETLSTIRKLDLERIGPGHGDWVTNPYEHIDFVYQRRMEREAQIKSLLGEYSSLTAAEITEKIYQQSIHPSIFEVAKRTTEAHLSKLIKEGAVTKTEAAYQKKG